MLCTFIATEKFYFYDASGHCLLRSIKMYQQKNRRRKIKGKSRNREQQEKNVERTVYLNRVSVFHFYSNTEN